MRIGVIGGGLMGSGIAEVCARAGVDVTVVEADAAGAERAQERIEKSLDRGARSGKLSGEQRQAAAERLAYSTTVDDIAGADAAIEAIIENEGAKRELFKRLDAVLPDAEFLASNTSSVPIMKLGAGTSKPERVLGLHFFNPVPVLPLVEVVRSIMTGEEALARARSFAQDTLGKVCIDSQDRAGFVVNALLFPYLNDAVRMLEAPTRLGEGGERKAVPGGDRLVVAERLRAELTLLEEPLRELRLELASKDESAVLERLQQLRGHALLRRPREREPLDTVRVGILRRGEAAFRKQELPE